ncbi:alkylation response protein AidB-like acyl-CoA dehydrogenase [Dongia mobilis]|uniref:Alkylation response protein AidB-like acyl-CoA dehydrogenase n=1 Tax=Dongia mobilis TaxID=578943 RepID=A0A4R6WSW7_9PROT|nr:acyl-CoA dehydrogenase family protein [Dongia mobilis]TDQ81970.1 alkylation response protein AidB-like acyl-CoA dehydrogenase [Dongia mobilis]
MSRTSQAEAVVNISPETGIDPIAIVRKLGPGFAARARTADDTDAFVAQNFAELKAAGLVTAGVPADLGGGGAGISALAGMVRELAQHCGSTALAFSMHTHQVAIPAWRWTRQQAAPVAPLLKRVAAENLVLLSSGGSDWIAGSGKAEKVEGGYRITARKVFTSAAEAGDILMTGAVWEEAPEGPMVLHFGVPMKSPHVSIIQSWKTMGMRGTGSNDVVINGHVVPEEAVALKRKQGEWHPLFHIISMIAFPLIYSAYLGVAEAARTRALELAAKRRQSNEVVALVGRMETELRTAQLAQAAMVALAETAQPGPATTNEIMIGRALVARHAIAATELAMEAAGGGAFYRDNELERHFRDVQGARYHPMQQGQQALYAGSVALGLDTAKVY